MTLFQAIIIGILSMLAASTPAMAGTTIGNYTLNRPLVAGLLLGIVFGDLRGCILIAMPMQVMWIALVTPGGTVASDLRAVSYIGIPLAYVGARAAGMDFGGKDASNTEVLPCFISTFQFRLHHFKGLRFNNVFMVMLYIVLGDFPFVDFRFLCKKINRIACL